MFRDNLIYFPDFCQIVLDRMRNPTEEEVFANQLLN